MIVNLSDTDTASTTRQLVQLREQGGAVTTGRALTLIVLAKNEDDLENIISTVNFVSREHLPRAPVLASDDPHLDNRLGAELRVDGDAGAVEIVIMHMSSEIGQHHSSVVTPLLLPDTPVVVWRPFETSQVPTVTPIDRITQCRITDSLCDPNSNAIYTRRTGYTPGDSSSGRSWLTNWRGVLAPTFDLPPHSPVIPVPIYGPKESPSVEVVADWLADRLELPVNRYPIGEEKIPVDEKGRAKPPVTFVTFERKNGQTLCIDVESATIASVTNGEKPPFKVALSRSTHPECLAEEPRHLDYDTAYGRILRGPSQVHTMGIQPPTSTTTSFINEPGVSDK